MNKRNFRDLLEKQWANGNFVCVGLDSDVGKIPAAHIGGSKHMSAAQLVTVFNDAIIAATGDLVCAYKINAAFYEKLGPEGWQAMQKTISRINAVAPDVPVIFDGKRADIGNTNDGYASAAFEFLKADAITVNPYFGAEALGPFLARADKGIIVLCRTSNPGAQEFQNLKVLDGTPLYAVVAQHVAEEWNKNGNCALVVGATAPDDELRIVRGIVGDMPILIPGIGVQGGDVEKTVSAGKDSRGQGMIINSSRGIIFASAEADFADAAQRETVKLRDLINQCR